MPFFYNMDIKAILRDKLIARYGEENVGDFHIMGTEGTYLGVYFDQLTITRSRGGETHDIRGICFGFVLENNFISVVCARHLYTSSELREGYVHSHAPTLGNVYYKHFCLGTSPYRVIAQNIQDIVNGDTVVTLGEGETLESVVTDNIESLVVAFDQMIRTESYDGGPYISINKLSRRETSQSSYLNRMNIYIDNLKFPGDSPMASSISLEEDKLIKEAPEESLTDPISFLKYLEASGIFGTTTPKDYLYRFGEFGPECRQASSGGSIENIRYTKDFIFKDEVKAVKILDMVTDNDNGDWVESNLNSRVLMEFYTLALLNKKINEKNEHKL